MPNGGKEGGMSKMIELDSFLVNLPLADSLSGLTQIMTSAQGELFKAEQVITKHGTDGSYFIRKQGVYLLTAYSQADHSKNALALAIVTESDRQILPIVSNSVEIWCNSQGSIATRGITDAYFAGVHFPMSL